MTKFENQGLYFNNLFSEKETDQLQLCHNIFTIFQALFRPRFIDLYF